MGQTDQLAAIDPASAVLEPPAAAPGRAVHEPAPFAAPQVPAVREDLPSVRLARLAAMTAAELDLAGIGAVADAGLSEQAVADIRAAVQGSTAANTKAAYTSDWRRFTLWAGAGGHPLLPAPPLVVAHYVTQAAAEQTGVGNWRYAPATLTRWVASINQVHTAAGLDAPGRSPRSSAARCPGSAGSGPPRRTGVPRCCWAISVCC